MKKKEKKKKESLGNLKVLSKLLFKRPKKQIILYKKWSEIILIIIFIKYFIYLNFIISLNMNIIKISTTKSYLNFNINLCIYCLKCNHLKKKNLFSINNFIF
jgi:hypothetical protein